MKTSLRSLTLALTLAAASVLGAAAAHAQTGTPQSPYVITGPTTIGKSGYYVLGNNINYTGTSGTIITIGASNVTLDFNGFYIAGAVNNTSQTTYGVQAYEQSNLTVKNGIIAYCQYGINIQGSGQSNTNSVGHQIDGMRITYCYTTGIYLNNSPASRITNCQISQIGYSSATTANGIVTFGTNGTVTLTDNIVDHVFGTTTNGIFIAQNNFARRNTVSYCLYGVRGGTYQDNLFYSVTNGFTGGSDAGGNSSF